MLEVPPKKVGIIPLYDPDESPGGIIIPEMAKTRSDQGIVKYVGNNCKWLKPGDWVLFSGYSGEAITIEGEGKLLIIPEALIVAVIQDIDEVVPTLYMKLGDGSYEYATWSHATKSMAYAAYKYADKYRMNPHPSRYREIEDRQRFNEEFVSAFADDEDEDK